MVVSAHIVLIIALTKNYNVQCTHVLFVGDTNRLVRSLYYYSWTAVGCSTGCIHTAAHCAAAVTFEHKTCAERRGAGLR